MADVRSLLRAEREARRINHRHASYTKTGILYCSLCGTQLKSDAVWASHIKSDQHQAGLQRAEEKSKGLKRKANDDDEDQKEEGGRKRPKSSAGQVEGLPTGFFDQRRDASPTEDGTAVHVPDDQRAREASGAADTTAPAAVDAAQDASERDEAVSKIDKQPQPPEQSVDEDEWAAFEREIAATEKQTRTALDALKAESAISSAPVTAEEMAAKAKEEQSVQRGRREAELEVEREEAQERMQDEFEEMEGLEERVRKLRERREALRRSAAVGEQEAYAPSSSPPVDEAGQESEDDSDVGEADDYGWA